MNKRTAELSNYIINKIIMEDQLQKSVGVTSEQKVYVYVCVS